MKKLFFLLILLCLPGAAYAQYPPTTDLSGTTARRVTIVTSLPAQCTPNRGEIIGVYSGSALETYECYQTDTWKKLARTSGSFATNDCVKFSSTGELISAGAACGAGGGGTVSGTTGTIAKFTSSSAVGNSIMTESSTDIATAGTQTVNGVTLNTSAGTSAATFSGILNPPGSNTTTLTYAGVVVKPTINSNAGVLNKTLDVLQIDTTNTNTTGFTVNLIDAMYGGTSKFTVDSTGTLNTGLIPAARLSTTVPVSIGGTGLTTGTSGGILWFNGSSALASSLALAGNGLTLGGGAGVAPFTTSGLSTDGSSVINLGVAGSLVGGISFRNGSSGAILIQPVSGALGTPVLSIPARTATLATSTGSTTTNNCAKFDASGNLVDAGTTCGGGGSSLTVGTTSISSGTATRLLYETSGNVLGEVSGVTSDGTNVTAGSGNLRATSPRITTGINDANGNSMLAFSPTASAVNYFQLTNTATTGGSTAFINTLEVAGSDTNGSIFIKTKGNDVTNGGQIITNPSWRYNRPAFALTGATDQGFGFKSGGAWFTINAANIDLGAGDGGTAGLVSISGGAKLVWHGNNSASEDCPPCGVVGLNKAANWVIGVVASPATADDSYPNGGTFGFTATSPTQITANQNNYDPGTASYLQRWSTDASRNVTGLTFASSTKVSGQIHKIWNVGTNNLVLVNDDGSSSTATNRFATSTGGNLTIPGGSCADVQYDASATRWRVSPCLSVTPTTSSSTDTFTNKTLDAEATGNTLSFPVTMWLPAAGCNNATAAPIWDLPTTNAASATCRTPSANTQRGLLDLSSASSTTNIAITTVKLPGDWVAGNGIDANLYWQSATTSGNVVWEISLACAGDADADDVTASYQAFSADAAKGTANQQHRHKNKYHNNWKLRRW